jgi:uncharacterized protein involved in type VI secretion and phage assembly
MYNHTADKKKNDFKFHGNYRGVVVDDQDPLRSGRVKIRVFGIYDNVPNEALPWAIYSDPFMGGQVGFGGFLIPDVGNHVWVFFENGDHHQPVYFAGAPFKDAHPKERLESDHEENRGSISYPRNKSLRTKSGHVIEIDDTEGNSRITIIHKSGTQITYQDNGDVYEHIVGNVKRVIDGNVVENIGGNVTQSVGGNVVETVGGNKNVTVTGNIIVRGKTIELN